MEKTKNTLKDLKKAEIIKGELNDYLDIVYTFLSNNNKKKYIKTKYVNYNIHKNGEYLTFVRYAGDDYRELFSDEFYSKLPTEIDKVYSKMRICPKNRHIFYKHPIFCIVDNKIYIEDLVIENKQELFEYLMHLISVNKKCVDELLKSLIEGSDRIEKYLSNITTTSNYLTVNAKMANAIQQITKNINISKNGTSEC